MTPREGPLLPGFAFFASLLGEVLHSAEDIMTCAPKAHIGIGCGVPVSVPKLAFIVDHRYNDHRYAEAKAHSAARGGVPDPDGAG